ncbi:MAG: magnesium transporter [Thermoleophilaceae bacterium]|jgi:magnesium transporter|nr:magnesium transporter [Thermoleophilaceae bacterium]
MIVDCAVYEDGKRREGNLELHQAYEAGRDNGDGSQGRFVWIGLKEPSPEEFESVAAEFHLHELAVEDAIKAHQRPKLEVYDETLFVVLKTACYIDETEDVETGEILLFVGDGFIVSVRHGEASDLHGVRKQAEERGDLLRCGTSAVLHAIIDHVVDDYEPVLAGIEDDIEEVEQQVFSPSRTNVTERIYKLKREVLELHRATAPLAEPLKKLAGGEYDNIVHDDIREYFRDVHDHVLRANETVDGYREMLHGILDANAAQVGVRQNDDMRRISAWVAIAAVPTAICAIYGMNFDHMPELRWTFGYPAVLIVIALICVVLYRQFKRVGWL